MIFKSYPTLKNINTVSAIMDVGNTDINISKVHSLNVHKTL